jgi:hypothetical protein
VEVFLTVIAALVVVASIVQTRAKITPKPEDLPSFDNSQIASLPSEEPTPTPTAVALVTPQPKSQPPQNQNIAEYIYPGSKIAASSSQNLTLTSGDDPGKITSWYKAKIQSKNLNVNSFVSTQANDKILNKLVGGSAQISINVEVSRDSASALVNITIGLTSR